MKNASKNPSDWTIPASWIADTERREVAQRAARPSHEVVASQEWSELQKPPLPKAAAAELAELRGGERPSRPAFLDDGTVDDPLAKAPVIGAVLAPDGSTIPLTAATVGKDVASPEQVGDVDYAGFTVPAPKEGFLRRQVRSVEEAWARGPVARRIAAAREGALRAQEMREHFREEMKAEETMAAERLATQRPTGGLVAAVEASMKRDAEAREAEHKRNSLPEYDEVDLDTARRRIDAAATRVVEAKAGVDAARMYVERSAATRAQLEQEVVGLHEQLAAIERRTKDDVRAAAAQGIAPPSSDAPEQLDAITRKLTEKKLALDVLPDIEKEHAAALAKAEAAHAQAAQEHARSKEYEQHVRVVIEVRVAVDELARLDGKINAAAAEDPRFKSKISYELRRCLPDRWQDCPQFYR